MSTNIYIPVLIKKNKVFHWWNCASYQVFINWYYFQILVSTREWMSSCELMSTEYFIYLYNCRRNLFFCRLDTFECDFLKRTSSSNDG
jgi:hypothetical protein